MKTFTFWILLAFTSFAQEYKDLEFFLPNSQVMNMASDGDNLWIATNGNGIFKYNFQSNSWEQYSTQQGNLQLDFFHCIAVSKDFVWAGSTDGLFILDRKTNNWSKRKFSLGGQLANWIRALTYDEKQNVLWIGRFKFLTKLDVESKRYKDYDLTVRNNEKTNTIKSLLIDGNYLWIGTEAGLHKYDLRKEISDAGAKIFYDTKNNAFNGDGEQVSISSILAEREFLWIGLDEFITDDRPEFNVGGLFRFDKKAEWNLFDVSKGLTGNGLYDLERTGNYIWASLYQFGRTTKEYFGRGLVLINRANNQVTQIRDDRIPRNVYSIFFDGINLWLGTENGLIKINFFNKLAQWNK